MSTVTTARFLLASERTFVGRLALLVAGAMFCFAYRGVVSLPAVTAFLALLLALLTLIGREQRQAAAVFLQTLPVPRRQVVLTGLGLDLLALPALLLASRASGRFELASAPSFLLAVLWGIGWSRVRPERWTALWCALSFAGALAVVHVGGAVGLALVFLATAAWLVVGPGALERKDRDASAPSDRSAPAKGATAPLSQANTLTLMGPATVVVVLLSLFLCLFATYRAPLGGVFCAIMPLTLALMAANTCSVRLGGPAREFFLTRPVSRLRYHLVPIGFSLAITLAPVMAGFVTAGLHDDARLAEDIHVVLCSPDTLRDRPRTDDLAAWEAYYARGLRREMSLPTLPSGALERTSDPKGYWTYVPSPTLRAAVRSSWQARQVRIALLAASIFLGALWLMSATPKGGWVGRVGAGARWSVRSLAQIAVLPLILAAREPEWLLMPAWLLAVAVVVTAVGLARALARAEVV
jgi:hypothetical protein